MISKISAERLMDVSADVVYHCIADYREHHRPGGFLPPAFSEFQIERGGVGAGTEARWIVEIGRSRRLVAATISEPEPGRTLVETAPGLRTTFTVAETADGTRVRFDTEVEERGLQGVLTRLFAQRAIGPVYDDELRRLEEYARAHGALAA